MYTEIQLKSILESITKLSNFDFSQKALITDENSNLNKIATSINELSYQLQQNRNLALQEQLAIMPAHEYVDDITKQKSENNVHAIVLNELINYKYALDKASIISITDQKGIINFVNDNFCEISKYSKEELIGQDHRIINSGHHSKDFIKDIWNHISNGKIWKGEIKNKDKNGNFYWVDTSIVPFINEKGKPYQYLSIRMDITNKKLADVVMLQSNNLLENKVKERTAELVSVIESLNLNKQLLIESEAFNSGILNSLNINIAVVDFKGKIVSTNNAWNTFAINNDIVIISNVGVGSDYFLTLENAITNGDTLAASILAGMKDVLYKKVDKFEFEYPCDTPIMQKWFLMRVTLYESNERMIVVSHSDITERKLAEDKTLFHANLLSKVEQSVIATDSFGNIIYWNEASHKIYGWSEAEAIGKNAIDLLFAPSSVKEGNDILENLKVGDSGASEILMKSKDLREFTVFISTSLIKNESGKLIGLIGVSLDITNKKLAEEKTVFDSKLLSAVEQSIIATDKYGKINYWNKASQKMFGWSEEEVIGKNIIDVLLISKSKQQGAEIIELLQTGSSWSGEIWMKSKDLEERVYYLSNYVIKNDADELVGLIGVAFDLTERKQIEKKILFDSKLLSAVEQSVIASDMTGKIIYWNEASHKIFGWSEEEAIGKNGTELFLEDKSAKQGVEILENLKIGKSWEGEVSRKTKDLKEIAVHLSVSIIKNDAGDSIGLIGVSFDLTERKLAEKKIVESENKLRNIFETGPGCIIKIDKNGYILNMNPAGLAMIDADNLEMVKGFNTVDMVKKESQKVYKDALKNVFKGKSQKFTIQIQGLKGNIRWMENNAVPMKDKDGNIVSMLIVSLDITENIKAQEDVFKSNERYNLIAKATNDVVWEYEFTTDIITRSNDGFEILFGFKITTENVNDPRYTKLIHPNDLDRVLASLMLAFNNQNEFIWEQEYKVLKPNGVYAFVHVKAIIIRDKNGVAIKLIGATQDVTEREKYINAIEDQNSKLREIAWQQSHVVRAPLSRMMGIVNLLRDVELNGEEFKEWVGHFVNSSAELDKVIHDISNKSDEFDLTFKI